MGPMRGGYPTGPKRPISKETIRRVARTFTPYRTQVIWTALAVLGSAGLGILPSIYLRTIIGQGLLARHLDIVTRYTIFTLGATLGATALSITHDMASVRKIADHVAMIYDGRIIWTGRASAIDSSGNPYVDQFVNGRAEGPIQMQIRNI